MKSMHGSRTQCQGAMTSCCVVAMVEELDQRIAYATSLLSLFRGSCSLRPVAYQEDEEKMSAAILQQ